RRGSIKSLTPSNPPASETTSFFRAYNVPVRTGRTTAVSAKTSSATGFCWRCSRIYIVPPCLLSKRIVVPARVVGQGLTTLRSIRGVAPFGFEFRGIRGLQGEVHCRSTTCPHSALSLRSVCQCRKSSLAVKGDVWGGLPAQAHAIIEQG